MVVLVRLVRLVGAFVSLRLVLEQPAAEPAGDRIRLHVLGLLRCTTTWSTIPSHGAPVKGGRGIGRAASGCPVGAARGDVIPTARPARPHSSRAARPRQAQRAGGIGQGCLTPAVT